MRAAELHRIHAGTNTINYQVVDDTGRSWFAKLYQGNLNREREAIDLTAYAGHAVPVPALQRTLNGDPIAALPRTTHSEPAAAVPPTVAGELIADAPRTAHGEPVPDAPRTTHGEPVDDAPRTDPGEPVAAGPRTAHGEPVDDAPHTAHGEPVDAAPRTAHGEPVTAAPRTAHGEPVDGVPRTVDGELVVGRLAMSLWEFVDGETAEGGITGARWPAVGNMLGRLHRRLSEHPRAAPTLRPATEVRDMVRARRSFDELIARFTARDELSPFEAWACEAAQERRALLGRAAAILTGLPALTTQVLHGDLASPNLMLRGDTVAAVIDFQPPKPGFVAWEIARIGCDPRTVILGDQWIDGLAVLLDAYRDEHPAARPDDLLSAVAAGCAHTLGSTFPLAEPAPVPASLELYARARHQAALTMLDRLPDVHELLSAGG